MDEVSWESVASYIFFDFDVGADKQALVMFFFVCRDHQVFAICGECEGGQRSLAFVFVEVEDRFEGAILELANGDVFVVVVSDVKCPPISRDSRVDDVFVCAQFVELGVRCGNFVKSILLLFRAVCHLKE